LHRGTGKWANAKGHARFLRDIRELQNADDRAQVLMSSHSPFVITEVWNGGDRNFIYQCSPVDGNAKLVKFVTQFRGHGHCSLAEILD
jgi:hypothetical protein